MTSRPAREPRPVRAVAPAELPGVPPARLPLKIVGAAADWPAARWTFPALRAQAGDRRITALTGLPRHGGALPGGQRSYERRMPLADFIDLAHRAGEPPCYLGYTRPADVLAGLEHGLAFGPLAAALAPAAAGRPSPRRRSGPRPGAAGDGGTDTRLWIGSAGTCSGLHSDLKDNVFVQLAGTKRVLLVPFAQSRLVYPFVDNLVNSRVDPENWDAGQFPAYGRATVYRTVVRPGDALFIPRGWWHHLRSQEPSISANHWFGPAITDAEYLRLLVGLGPRHVGRALADLVRYRKPGRRHDPDFFFSPPPTGERLLSLVRHGSFSRDNDPALDA